MAPYPHAEESGIGRPSCRRHALRRHHPPPQTSAAGLLERIATGGVGRQAVRRHRAPGPPVRHALRPHRPGAAAAGDSPRGASGAEPDGPGRLAEGLRPRQLPPDRGVFRGRAEPADQRRASGRLLHGQTVRSPEAGLRGTGVGLAAGSRPRQRRNRAPSPRQGVLDVVPAGRPIHRLSHRRHAGRPGVGGPLGRGLRRHPDGGLLLGESGVRPAL